MSLLYLSNNSIFTLSPDPPIHMANGGTLNARPGSAAASTSKEVLVLSQGNISSAGGIVRLNLVTKKAAVLLNNYQGLQFNSPNDIVVHPKSGMNQHSGSQ